ncbi:MAG: PHP domain-containing protein [Anaerotignaceae bacterium]
MLKLYVEVDEPMITEKYIDLHTHSTFSDGTYTPTQLVQAARDANLYAVALTDHDCVDGVSEALEAGKTFGIEVIPGIELAAYYNNPSETEIHIVGLFLDYTNKDLLEKTKEIMYERVQRNIKMTARLSELGFPMTYDELLAEAGRDSCSRAHYANLMVKKGYVKTKKEAFQKYISHGMPGFVPRILPTPQECIDLITKSGGVAVLAHPTLYGMNYNQIRIMAKELMGMGLKAIEVKYSTYKPEQEREITRIAAELGLKSSGGSDFHGLNKPDISIGTGLGRLRIPEEFLEKLRP